MAILRLFWLAVISCWMIGCATQIHTTAITYHGQGSEQRGTIFVSSGTEDQSKSLAFNSVRNRVSQHLALKGYQPVNDYRDAMYVAYVTYSISGGKTINETVPVFGQTGGGTTTYSSGTVTSGGGFANYSGSTYTPPSFGIVGMANTSRTEYARQVQIDIFKVEGKKLGPKVFELHGSSSGSCNNLYAVLPTIIDGMFQEFPGEDGKSKLVKLYWDGSC